jgi:hypothetical protein
VSIRSDIAQIVPYRALLVAAIAAIAIAIPSGTASGGGVRVDASLGGCERSGGGTVCRIDASFTGVAGADYYTAAVTAPNGSRQDFGVVGAGATSVWARYGGNGVYTLTITAWSDGKRVKRGAAGAGG